MKNNALSQRSLSSRPSQRSQILEGSNAIAITVKNCRPAVVSAYPITPQTHIVEDLAKYKADGEADYEFVRAESEFAAASIVLGASGTGVRTYTATSSQGLLLMIEVLYNIAGMRLPIVMTCANRAVSAPISIWNDQQDAMAARDSGWIMLFAEDHQETVSQHIMAFKIAEALKLPIMLNIDGFILTHSFEPVNIPTEKEIKKYLPAYKPTKGEFLDPKNPATLGALATPAHYMEIRTDLHNDLTASIAMIKSEFTALSQALPDVIKPKHKLTKIDNGVLEYYGPNNPKTILVAMGSVVGTIKDVIDESNNKALSFLDGVGVLKIKLFRPFPKDDVLSIIKKAKHVAVIDKSISLGQMGVLASEVRAAACGQTNANIRSFVVGLGGRDITKDIIKKIIVEAKKKDDQPMFVGK